MEAKRRSKPEKAIFSDPEWEKAKAARRNIDHNDAVQESFFLQKQFRSMWNDRTPTSPVDLNQILRTLTDKKIPFVLTGAQAIGGWTGIDLEKLEALGEKVWSGGGGKQILRLVEQVKAGEAIDLEAARRPRD